MMQLKALVKRNCKLFFKDKGMFFSSLITPIILLLLYITFLANVYRDSFVSNMPANTPESLINATVNGQLLSSLLAVCCVTVAFCSNLLMVQDKANESRNDLTITPIKKTTLALGYYISTFLVTFIICFVALIVCLVYMAFTGWYMSFIDVILIFVDVILLTMFGTALSSIVNYFLNTQGQMSAVGTIVSCSYGFICGAYMPISQFGDGLQTILSFLPSTYATALLKNHTLNGVFKEMGEMGWNEQLQGIRDSVDCNVYFFNNKVSITSMFFIVLITVLLCIIIYIIMNVIRIKKVNKAN